MGLIFKDMDNFQPQDMPPDMLAHQLVDVGYLGPHMNVDGMAMMQDPNFMTTASESHESIDAAMLAAFDENDPLNVRRSISYSSSSAQSQSPQLHNQFPGSELPHLQTFNNPFTNTLEQISPVTAGSSSRRDSDDESQRVEVSYHCHLYLYLERVTV